MGMLSNLADGLKGASGNLASIRESVATIKGSNQSVPVFANNSAQPPAPSMNTALYIGGGLLLVAVVVFLMKRKG